MCVKKIQKFKWRAVSDVAHWDNKSGFDLRGMSISYKVHEQVVQSSSELEPYELGYLSP